MNECIELRTNLVRKNLNSFEKDSFFFKIEIEDRKGKPPKTAFESPVRQFVKNDIKNKLEFLPYILNTSRLEITHDEYNNDKILISLVMKNQENEEIKYNPVRFKYSDFLENDTITFKINDDLSLTLNHRKIKCWSLHEYLNYGFNLNIGMAIDFTGSNKDPRKENSLHYCNGIVDNPYEKAIRICLKIGLQYDKDGKYPVYGYGAKMPGESVVNHCFNLSLSDDPEIEGFENCIKIYRQNLTRISFAGPTHLTPVLTEFIKEIKKVSDDIRNYGTLLILTDGATNDKDEFIDKIVEASYLPLSIIIVGIGNADFKYMKTFDADNSSLLDSKGRRAFRDIVQFVPFEKFKTDIKALGDELFYEIPTQITEYFSLKGIKPHHLENQ